MSICIYHGNCADGFGAAWVVRKALGEIDMRDIAPTVAKLLGVSLPRATGKPLF